jgi:hypothetical protein
LQVLFEHKDTQDSVIFSKNIIPRMQDSAESGFIDIDNTNKPININYEESKTSAAPRPASGLSAYDAVVS